MRQSQPPGFCLPAAITASGLLPSCGNHSLRASAFLRQSQPPGICLSAALAASWARAYLAAKTNQFLVTSTCPTQPSLIPVVYAYLHAVCVRGMLMMYDACLHVVCVRGMLITRMRKHACAQICRLCKNASPQCAAKPAQSGRRLPPPPHGFGVLFMFFPRNSQFATSHCVPHGFAVRCVSALHTFSGKSKDCAPHGFAELF